MIIRSHVKDTTVAFAIILCSLLPASSFARTSQPHHKAASRATSHKKKPDRAHAQSIELRRAANEAGLDRDKLAGLNAYQMHLDAAQRGMRQAEAATKPNQK